MSEHSEKLEILCTASKKQNAERGPLFFQAEMLENDAQRPRRIKERLKIWNFRPREVTLFFNRYGHFDINLEL